MKKPLETDIEDRVKSYLSKIELYPFSVIYTLAITVNSYDGLLSITFFTDLDFNDFLEVIQYNKSSCDKSGYMILRDTNTIILTGLALLKFCYGDKRDI